MRYVTRVATDGRSRVLPLVPIAAAVLLILIDGPMFAVAPRNRLGDLIPYVLVPIVAAVAAALIGMPLLWLSLRIGLRRFWQVSAVGAVGGALAGQLLVMATGADQASPGVLHSLSDLRGFGILGASVAAIHWIWMIGRSSHRVATSIGVLLVAEMTLYFWVFARG